MSKERVLTAAERIETHSAALAEAALDFFDGIAALRRAAYSKGGTAGADEVASAAAPAAEEIVGTLIASGFGSVLADAHCSAHNILAVGDLTERWRLRFERGRLETSRTA